MLLLLLVWLWLLLALLLPALAMAQTWTRIATENQTFTVPTAQTVRYGAGTQWVERLVSGTGQCSNAFFGSDPAKMTVKACETLSAAPTPPVVQTPAALSMPPDGWGGRNAHVGYSAVIGAVAVVVKIVLTRLDGMEGWAKLLE